jgi:hypothetical protein
MKRIATTAMAAILAVGTAHAQPPAPRQVQRPPAAQPQPRPQPQRPPVPAQRPAAPAVPTRVTARTLTALCGQDRSDCIAYIVGAADAFASALVASGRPQVFCFPRGTTNDQIAQSTVLYLRAHPEEAGNNAGIVVLAGLRTTYPCGF